MRHKSKESGTLSSRSRYANPNVRKVARAIEEQTLNKISRRHHAMGTMMRAFGPRSLFPTILALYH